MDVSRKLFPTVQPLSDCVTAINDGAYHGPEYYGTRSIRPPKSVSHYIPSGVGDYRPHHHRPQNPELGERLRFLWGIRPRRPQWWALMLVERRPLFHAAHSTAYEKPRHDGRA
jgi:hypothetical protein